MKPKGAKKKISGTDGAGYEVLGHIWIEGPEGSFLGIGRVELLETIGECGSISAAARSIKISYRKAWELVESMNRQAGEPLVDATTGGRGGGGAVLTDAGRRAVKLFRKLDAEFKKFCEFEAGRICKSL